jgi:hypothetical protein
VSTLRKIAPSAIAVAVLAIASYVVIFHGENIVTLTLTFLRAESARNHGGGPGGFFKFTIALLSGLGLRWLACRVAAAGRFFWSAPEPLPDSGLEAKDRISLANDLRANRIQLITTMVQALGGIAVLIGIYVAWANLKTTQEAQKATQTNQADALKITQKGQITDRFTKAIDQLGATDDKGNPRMELRLGGIYALESIANESPEYHWPIMEILTTYVRVYAPLMPEATQSSSATANAPSENAKQATRLPIPVHSPDIQAILTVLGRRDRVFEVFEEVKDEYLNLADTDLEGANLDYANLDYAHLDGAHLDGASLTMANLTDAHLNGVHLVGAHLYGARLNGVHLVGADLTDADLTDANLTRASLEAAAGLTQGQVNSAHGNKDTGLPSGILMPVSWKGE